MSVKLLVFTVLLIINTVNSVPPYFTVTKNSDLFPLTIIHVNDFHARFEEVDPSGGPCKEGDKCIGGYARVVSKIKEIKKYKEDKNPIYLDAGDNFQGTLWYNIGRWNVTQEFLNYYPADAITIGNHEFDHQIAGLVPFLKSLTAPVVVSNIDDSKEPTIQNLYKKSVVLERNGKKIGIIGVILETTNQISNTGKLRFYNESKSVRDEAERLKAEGVNMIIVLSHCGYDVDQIIAAKCGPNVDVIVGAHSHTFLYTGDKLPGPDKPKGPYPTIVKQEASNHKVLVVQAASYSRYVGDLTVYFDEDGIIQRHEGQPHYLSSDVEKDPSIVNALQPWKNIVDAKGKQIIGSTAVELTKKDCGSGECNLGNMMADAFVYAAVTQLPVKDPEHWTNVSIAIVNQGSLRIPLEKGNLTYNHIVTLSPFENELVAFSLLGKYLIEALEYSIESSSYLSPLSYFIDNGEVHFNFRNMLHSSGLKVVYDLSQPDGKRVKSVLVRCADCDIPRYEKLKENKEYRIVTSSFVADGGDGFTMIKKHKFDYSNFSNDVEAVTEYVRHNSPITTAKEGRIRFV